MLCKILINPVDSIGYCADIAKSPVLCINPGTNTHTGRSCTPFASAKGHKWNGI